MLRLRGKRRGFHLAALLMVPVALFAIMREWISWLPVTRHIQGVATNIIFTADGQVLQVEVDGSNLGWWDAANGKLLRRTSFPRNAFQYACWSASGTTLATIDDVDDEKASQVRVWDATNGRLRRSWTIPDGWNCLHFAPDGKTIASGSGRSGSVRLWDVKTGALLHLWHSELDRAAQLAFSADGHCLAATGRDGVISVWDMRQNHLTWSLPANTNPDPSLLFSPNGKLFADAIDNNVELRSARTGQLLRTIYSGGDDPRIIRFSPDSTVLATGGIAGAVYLWDVTTGKLLRTLRGHHADITALAYSPDGATLASGSLDKTVKLWRVR